MKKIFKTFTIFLIFTLTITGCDKKSENESLTKITLAEVTHSVFYSPLYVSIENGYFKDNGIDIELILTSGADKTAASVLSNDAQIGFSGPEATIYIYNSNEKDYLKTFAGLTKKDGQFIVGSCEEKDNFKISNLTNKTVLAGRSGGMPLMMFTYALKESNIDQKDVNIDTSVEFAALSGAFISKTGDYVNLFEPNATNIEKNKYGCVLTSLGNIVGDVPYTTFYSKASYIENNKEIIDSFTKAINEGLKFVQENDANTIAKAIINQFPDISLEDLTIIVQRYKDIDAWFENTDIPKETFDRLQDIMIYNKAIEEKVKFEDLFI